jgi:hypothetical protein
LQNISLAHERQGNKKDCLARNMASGYVVGVPTGMNGTVGGSAFVIDFVVPPALAPLQALPQEQLLRRQRVLSAALKLRASRPK